jgi:hypothetical protein
VRHPFNCPYIPHARSFAVEHQAQQWELSAQIRLPPLNPKTAAPLKTLAAGLGCLFAGPLGEGGQILQWSPNESGSTLPPGATSWDKPERLH